MLLVTVILAAEMLLMTAVGMMIQRLRIVGPDFSGQLTRLLMAIPLPCLIFKSIAGVEASWAQLKNCGVVFLCSLLVCLVQFLVGQGFYLAMGRTGRGRITRYGILFTHFSFMGIPLMESLFGAEGLLYYSIFLIPVRALYYGATKALLLPPDAEYEKKSPAAHIRETLSNPCLLAVIAGLAFYEVFGLIFPGFSWGALLPRPLAAFAEGVCTCVLWVITKLSGLCTPVGLLICGMTLGRLEIRDLLSVRFLRLPVIRCVCMPLLFLGILKLITLAVPLDPMVSSMVLVYTALPVSSLISAYTVQCDPDVSDQVEASGALLYSTVLSMLTVPVWYHVLTAALL